MSEKTKEYDPLLDPALKVDATAAALDRIMPLWWRAQLTAAARAPCPAETLCQQDVGEKPGADGAGHDQL